MGESLLLNIVAAMHIQEADDNNIPWDCECNACKDAREVKIPFRKENEDVGVTTMAECIKKVIQEKKGKLMNNG